MDYKLLPTDEKGGIPPPVQVPVPEDRRAKRARRLATLARHIAVFSLVFLALRYWGAQLRAEVDAEAGAWLANSFASDHHGAHAHHHYHGGKKRFPLHGKAAEHLFL